MRRPSHHVLLCSALVLAVFSITGHLAMGRRASGGRAAAAPRVARTQPIVLSSAPATRPAQTRQVAGRVVDTLGFLLADASVSAGAYRTRTDANGGFRLELPECAFADLQIARQSHRARVVRAYPGAGELLFAALEPSAPWDRDAAIVPGASTVGGVAAADGLVGEGFVRGDAGAPLADALVAVVESGALARTDAAGRYEIALPPSTSTLIVHCPRGGRGDLGYAARSESVTPSRTHGRVPLPELQVRTAVALRGTVRDGNGQPQAGVPLQIVGRGFVRAIASGEGGAFRLAGLLPGDYELRAFACRGALGTALAVRLDGPVTDCELHLRALSERRLRIVTAGGAPVARAIVATTVDGLRREVAHGDGDGWVQLRAGEPAASYEVRTAGDYRPMRVLEAPDGADRIVVALP